VAKDGEADRSRHGRATSSDAHCQRTCAGAGVWIPRCANCFDHVFKVPTASLSTAASTCVSVDVAAITGRRCRQAHIHTDGTITAAASSVPNTCARLGCVPGAGSPPNTNAITQTAMTEMTSAQPNTNTSRRRSLLTRCEYSSRNFEFVPSYGHMPKITLCLIRPGDCRVTAHTIKNRNDKHR
jgi:hypothetical protein